MPDQPIFFNNEFALREVIEMGVFKLKARKNKFWVFKEIENRKDNLICASISIENPKGFNYICKVLSSQDGNQIGSL